MSFQNKGLWMTKSADCLTDGEVTYDSSASNEPKRSHQWFMDGAEADLFPNKRQAVEVPNSTFFLGMANLNVSPWGNTPNFHSIPAQFSERLFDSETARTIDFDDRNIPSVSTGNINMNIRKVEDPFGIVSSFGLSMTDDPRSGFNYGGIRKVKVSQVKDVENVMSVPLEHAYIREDDVSVSEVQAYSKAGESSISMGLSYNGGNEHAISETFNGEGSSISIGQHFKKGNDNLSMSRPYSDGNDNMAVNHTYKESNGPISIGQPFSKVDSTFISIGQTYNKDANNFVSMSRKTHTLNEGDARISSSNHTYNKGTSDHSSFGHSYNKGESNIISFGGFHDDDDDETDPSGRLINTYDLLMGHASVQRSEVPIGRDLAELNTNAFASESQAHISGAGTVSKKKDEQKVSKKVTPNNFPSNVRSLLSTGMLDGVPVKYIAWSREELRGIIKGSGYLCGCQTCNSSKVINAYEFERHAGCKTKHPNNHIYFENGKTVYGIVQELRSTPQSLLFEVIQTITGSPINQKSFRLWKESFLAATRELQRIYGKDEVKQLS